MESLARENYQMHMTNNRCNLKVMIAPNKRSTLFSPTPVRRGLTPANTVVITTLVTGVCFSSPAAISALHKDVFVHPGRLTGTDVQRGKTSWFGQYGYGKYRDGLNNHIWRDTGDNGQTASGLPQTMPGIALPSRKHLKHWYEVELKGQKFRVRQTDVGPAAWTGRSIDINAPLADMAGYAPNCSRKEKAKGCALFPTDSVVKYRYLGPPSKTPPVHDLPYNVAQFPLPKMALLGDSPADFPLANRAVTAAIPGQIPLDEMSAGLPPPMAVPKKKTMAELPAKLCSTKTPYGLHPVIHKSMTEASKLLPSGYCVRFDNAKRNHSSVGGSSYHIKEDQHGALAVDIQIHHNNKKLPNIHSPKHFAVY